MVFTGKEPNAEKILKEKIILEQVIFDGVWKTKHSALVSLCSHLFSASNLKDLANRAVTLKKYMEDISMFQDISIHVTASNKTFNGVNVIMKVTEPKRFLLHAGAGINNINEANSYMQLACRNAFGSGELLKTSISVCQELKAMFDFDFAKPFLSVLNSGMRFNIYRKVRPLSQCNGISNDVGASIELRHRLWKNWIYSLCLINCWRHFKTSSDVFLIREHAGHSVKNSVENSLIYCTLNNMLMPTSGNFFKLSQELAGGSGDVNFIRHSLDLKTNFQLPFNLINANSFSFNHVIANSPRTLLCMDRIFLGGSQNLRGFVPNCIGCQTNGNCLGGSSSICFVTHLYRRIFGDFLYAHAFAAVGSLWYAPVNLELSKLVKELSTGRRRSSVGMGLLFKIGSFCRVEINYCFPLEYQIEDRIHRGLQVGAVFYNARRY
ncbi:SAM50-like protein gop-3 [Trichinella nativa]|uniref:SAM50-like protein gop-3 n=1 Tax=Trichinella nativa TaxID=6335 RepID=A0A0V1LUM5_9BILA|nr:SAM50-like protein gop-3 [Trichinella nativa]